MGYKKDGGKYVFDGKTERPLTRENIFGTQKKDTDFDVFGNAYSSLIGCNTQPREEITDHYFDDIFK